MDGAAGSVDGLNNDDSAAIDTEEKLVSGLELATTQLKMPPFNNLQQRLEELGAKKASAPTLLDTLPTTSLPHVPPSISPQAGMKAPSPPTTTSPLHPIILPIMTISPPTTTVPSHPIVPPIMTIPPPQYCQISGCIKTGAAKVKGLTLKVNTLQASNSIAKERADCLQAENLKMMALLSEKNKIKKMYTAVFDSETSISTNNTRVGDL